MKLIIIQGAPATGKTTVAKKLADDLACTYFSKDGYKEMKFDELNRIPTFKEWVALELEAKRKLHETVLACKPDDCLVIESNFRKNDKIFLQKNLEKFDSIYEVFFYVTGLTSFIRYRKRNKQSEWHRGHLAKPYGYPIVAWVNFLSLIKLPLHKPLLLSENTLKVNTTDFSKVDYKDILKFVKG